MQALMVGPVRASHAYHGDSMTAALQILGWTAWALAAVLALFAWHVVLVTLLEARRVRFMNAASAVVLTWLASWFVIVDLNKLHLLWMLPTVFVALDLLQPSLTRAGRR